jgi:hypothetical protein
VESDVVQFGSLIEGTHFFHVIFLAQLYSYFLKISFNIIPASDPRAHYIFDVPNSILYIVPNDQSQSELCEMFSNAVSC